MSFEDWNLLNAKPKPTSSDGVKSFNLTTPPKTDIWRPDATSDIFTAPFMYRSLKTSEFKSIAVTVSGHWRTQFDQGGLAIAFPTTEGPRKWIKAGVEFYNGKPACSTVTADRFSDWSLCPMVVDGAQKARFEAVRDGPMLVVNLIEGDQRRPLREITWAFIEEREADAEVWVGVYAAKPTAEDDDATKGLEVRFEDLELLA